MTLTQEHIQNLVFHFYKRVQKDPLLGPIFNEVAKVNWDHHLPLICQFWNSIMLKTNEYHGNAFRKHLELGKKTKLNEIHFTRWLQIFQAESIIYLPSQDAQCIVHKARLIAKSLKFATINVS